MYSKYLAQCKTFRNAEKGRNIANNTRMFMEGENIIISHHNTNILTFRPDNTLKVSLNGWTSNTTLSRVRKYTRIYITSDKILGFPYSSNDSIEIDLNTRTIIKNENSGVENKLLNIFKDLLVKYCSPYHKKTKYLKEEISSTKDMLRLVSDSFNIDMEGIRKEIKRHKSVKNEVKTTYSTGKGLYNVNGKIMQLKSLPTPYIGGCFIDTKDNQLRYFYDTKTEYVSPLPNMEEHVNKYYIVNGKFLKLLEKADLYYFDERWGVNTFTSVSFLNDLTSGKISKCELMDALS